MKEAIVSAGPQVNITDVPLPVPKEGQVLIRVVVSGSNPKDFKSTLYLPPANNGDDAAGYVESVGRGVVEFKKGDRVAGFHEMLTPHGSFAEYAITWAHTTFHIPNNISFEEAATVPLTAMTAAIGLYNNLRLPSPWHPEEDRPEAGPLVVYGAGAAVGCYAVQLAKKSNIHPLICVAGQSGAHVQSFIDRSKGDVVIDYRQGHEFVLAEIKKALRGKPLRNAFDSVADHGSYKVLGAVLEPQGSRLSMVLPYDRSRMPQTPGVTWPEGFVKPTLEGVSDGIEVFWTAVGSVHGSDKHFGYVVFRYLALGLQEGWLKPHPYEVIPGGLNGIVKGLENLRDGKAHSGKYVFRIAETEVLV